MGKISGQAFERFILPRLGAPRDDVLLGPAHGGDAGIVDLGAGQVLAVTTDPFFVMPELGWPRAGWLAVHILASDAATSGLRPSHLTVDLNLPLTMDDADLEAMWNAVHGACAALGVAVLAGHTGRYDGCSFPMVGGATMLSRGAKQEYLTPAMARPGDTILITKGAAIETAGMFGVLLPDLLARRAGGQVAEAAAGLFWSISVVRDAAAAVEAGIHDNGVTSLHDVAEGGIWGGLIELSRASGHGIVVDRAAISIRPEVAAICSCFAIDPYAASGQGALIVTCRPHRTTAVLDRLEKAGIEASACGEVRPTGGLHTVIEGREHPLNHPPPDPFWPALQKAMKP